MFLGVHMHVNKGIAYEMTEAKFFGRGWVFLGRFYHRCDDGVGSFILKVFGL